MSVDKGRKGKFNPHGKLNVTGRFTPVCTVKTRLRQRSYPVKSREKRTEPLPLSNTRPPWRQLDSRTWCYYLSNGEGLGTTCVSYFLFTRKHSNSVTLKPPINKYVVLGRVRMTELSVNYVYITHKLKHDPWQSNPYIVTCCVFREEITSNVDTPSVLFIWFY